MEKGAGERGELTGIGGDKRGWGEYSKGIMYTDEILKGQI